MTDLRQAAQQTLEALEEYVNVVVSVNDPNEWTPKVADAGEPARKAITALREALAQPEQEPVTWSVIDPAGNILATEKNAIRGWARVNGYKLTVEGLLGLHELGWRVLPTSPPAAQRQWAGLTDDDWVEIDNKKGTALDSFAQGAVWAADQLKERNT